MKVRCGNFSSGLLARVICLCLLFPFIGPSERGCRPGVAEARAQVIAATLSGTVQDQTGAVVPDVRVTVLNSGNGIERQVTTDSNGYFVIAMLDAGEYALTVEMPGFRMLTEDLILESGANRILTITLRPRDLSESITVQATGKSADIQGNHIDIGSATLKYSMTGRQVSALPVWSTALGRNGLAVLPFLVPGVSPTSATGSADALVNRLGSQMSVNGSRPSSINFNLEGGDNNDLEYNRASSPLPNPDVLQEFIVATNNYGAEQGRNSGGILDAVIKSGTTRYSGNARYYLMNEALNARGFFDSRVPIERLKTFGGQLGGPVVVPRLFEPAEKLLFFFDYERTRYRQERTSAPILVWTERERRGDFSRSADLSGPRDPLTLKPFPRGFIPADRIDLLARLYMDRFIPLPNEGDRLFRQLLLDQALTGQLTSRLDGKLSKSDSLSAVLIRTSSVVSNGTPILPVGSKDDRDSTNTNLTVRETHSFSPRAVGQLTLTFARYDSIRSFSFPGASGILPQDVGFVGVHPQSSRFPTLPSVGILPSGMSIADGSPSETSKTTWQIKEDVSLAKLNGVLKFGAETRGFKQQSVTESDNGHFVFSNAYTLNFVSDFLLGKAISFTQASGSSIYPRQRSYYFYAADDWRLKPNLTLNLGLRYELAPPLTDKLDQVTAFRPGQSSERFPDAPVGLLFAGDPDPVLGRVPRGVYPADANNLAPRIGAAYSPKPESGLLRFIFGNGKSAIRAGAGIFYDQTAGNSFTRFSFVQPFSVKQSLSFDQIRNKGGTFANPFGTLDNPWPIDLSKRAFTGTPDTRTLDPTFRTAQTYQYNLSLQRELGWSLLMEIAYVGSTSLKLNRARELNIAAVSEAPGKAPPRHRPYSSLGSVLSQESSGRARYDSFQFRIARRPVKGLMLDGSYVLGKSLDNGSSPDQLAGPDQLRWARSSFDRRHNIVVSYGYELPPTRMHGWLGGVVNGWQIGGITELRTGMPIDIVQFWAGPLNGVVPYRVPDFVGPYKRLNPRKSQTLVVNGNALTGNFFFDPGAFKQAGADYTQPGTLGRNVFSGPGINLWSLSIIKRIPITESQYFSLRSDIRNIFNRAHFENPTTPLPNATFGQVSSAGPGRNVQLSLKYTF